MKITKVINNNAISSLDAQGREIIVMGKGIGFQKKVGDQIAEDKIEKIFHLSDEQQSKFEKIAKEIPYEYMKLADAIIEQAAGYLGKKMSKSIFLTLTDHLNYAIERQKQGIIFHNALLWEIKKYYPREFVAGQRSLDLIKVQTGVELCEDEAGFFALHFLNAEMDGNMSDAIRMPEMIKDILNIVRYTMMIDFDEESLSYERFVTHLKFFIQRAIANKFYDSESEAEAFQSLVVTCAEEYACARKIKAYMEQHVDYEVSDEEILYLTMHIHRLNRAV